jgi:hypothetical protein
LGTVYPSQVARQQQQQQQLDNILETLTRITERLENNTRRTSRAPSPDSSDDESTQTLYHQTDPESARAILQSQTMYRGSNGLAGGAIYFAESERDTNHKAKSHGVVLQADVHLGRSKRLSPSGEQTNYSQLKSQGYDSVTIDRPGGTEYAVYNYGQVKNIRRA